MAEATPDHHTIDELFQILCVRNIPPVQARRQILEACQEDKLKIGFRFRNGPSGRIHYQSWELMPFMPPAVPIKPAAPIANAPTAPVVEAPASKTDPPTKISQLKWTKDYLTKDKRDELSKKYDQVSKAAAEVFNVMKTDSRVEPYKNARSLERHLAGIFPKRQKPRK